jgi:crossover junction endodeoxyribonuclease RusA
VLGKPAPQGSKRHVGRGILLESSKRCKPWRQAVALAAKESLPDGWYAIVDKPMSASIAFAFDRPRSHFNKNGSLKASAPTHCSKRIGDLDKLCRAVFDSLDTANVVKDDSQFVSLYAHRRFTLENEQPCAIITVTALS